MSGSEDLEFLIILWCLVSLWSSLMPMPDRITDRTTTVHQRWRCNWSVVRRAAEKEEVWSVWKRKQTDKIPVIRTTMTN